MAASIDSVDTERGQVLTDATNGSEGGQKDQVSSFSTPTQEPSRAEGARPAERLNTCKVHLRAQQPLSPVPSSKRGSIRLLSVYIKKPAAGKVLLPWLLRRGSLYVN